MRVFDNCFLFLELLLLICVCYSDIRRANYWHSDASTTSIHSYLDSMEKIPQMILEKELVRYGGSIISAAPEHKNLIRTGRKLLMKSDVSQDEVSNSNTGDVNNHTMKKISNGRKRKRRSRNIKPLKNKQGHQKDDNGVGAFTEDYRVPRSHPPRNN